MLFNRGGNRPGGTGDCAEDIKNWWMACPTFYKFLFITTTFNYLFNAFISQIFYYLLVQVPLRTVTSFFFWTLSTTFLCPRDFFDWLIGIYLVYYDGKRIEQRIGTVHYAIEMIFKNTLIQIAYTILMYIGSLIFSPMLLTVPSFGLFPTFMLFLTLRGLAAPEEERPFMCFPVMVRNKMYPWILYGLICLISQSLVPDLLAAIGIAYLEVYFFNGQILTIQKQTLQRYEKGCIFSKLYSRPDFVTVDGAGVDDSQQLPVSQPQPQQQPQQSAFAGRGVSIGQGNAQSVFSQQPPQQVVINPSQNQYQQPQQDQQSVSQNEQELRRQAALAAEARMAQQEKQENEPENIDDLPDKNDNQQNQNQNKQKKGYDQLNEESPQEDLL